MILFDPLLNTNVIIIHLDYLGFISCHLNFYYLRFLVKYSIFKQLVCFIFNDRCIE